MDEEAEEVADHLGDQVVGHLSTLLLMKMMMDQEMATFNPFRIIMKSITSLLIAKAKMIHSPRIRSHLNLLYLILKLNRFQNNQVLQQVVVVLTHRHYFTRTQWTRNLLLKVFNSDMNNSALILFRVAYLGQKSTRSR